MPLPASYTLTLPKAGMDTIVAALAELPYKVARPVLDEAMRQFIEQEQVAEAAAAKQAEPTPPQDN